VEGVEQLENDDGIVTEVATEEFLEKPLSLYVNENGLMNG